jgi:hypothetical protein
LGGYPAGLFFSGGREDLDRRFRRPVLDPIAQAARQTGERQDDKNNPDLWLHADLHSTIQYD